MRETKSKWALSLSIELRNSRRSLDLLQQGARNERKKTEGTRKIEEKERRNQGGKTKRDEITK